jgi:hypothetical protein
MEDKKQWMNEWMNEWICLVSSTSYIVSHYAAVPSILLLLGQHSLARVLGGPQSHSGHYGKNKNPNTSVGTSHSAKQTISTPSVLMPNRQSYSRRAKVRVRVTLQLTVSQSVCWYRAPSGLTTRYLLLLDSYGLVLWGGAFSDERTGLSCVRVGQQWLVGCQYIQLYIFYMLYMRYYENKIQYIQGLCHSGPGTADYALFVPAFATTADLRHLIGRMLDSRKVKAPYISYGLLRLVQCCKHFHCNYI